MEFPIQLQNGVTLSYVEHGDPAGVPVLLLHGVTDSWRSFEPVLPHLPRTVRAFALTQRGHGDADRPATGYRTRDFAKDAAEFLDAVGVEQAIVVGHSMGSTHALRFAIDFPERTLGLVILGAFAGYKRNAVIAEFWRDTVATLVDPVTTELAREFQLSTLANPVAPALLEMVVAESLKVPARVWRAAFEGLLEDDFASELDRVKVPAHIFWGAQDVFCPRADQDALVQAIPGSRLTVYARSGHALHWEEPARFAADLSGIAARAAGLRTMDAVL